MAGAIFTERDFWIAIRRALLQVIKAIEKRYGIESET